MAWKALDRNDGPPRAEGDRLSEAVKARIRVFFDRYETKRAVLLPALHIVQDEFGYVGWRAMEDIAELLELPPSEVFDAVTFYTYFWTHPRGRKVITVCRSASCEVMGSEGILAECKNVLGISEHQTTPDGNYSLQTEECLAQCDHAPCMKINERTYSCVKVSEVRGILEDPNNDRLDIPRSDLYDGAKRYGAV